MKRKERHLSMALLLLIMIVTIAYAPMAAAISKKQKLIFDLGIRYFNVSNGCADSNDSIITTPSGNAANAHSGEDVLKFAAAPINSSFGVSDQQAEKWFLSTNSYAVRHFGLNSSNIGEVTAAIKAEGISPAFFYGYAVNEGGGAGGFINHYMHDSGGGAVGNATTDAKYLAQESNSTNGRVAYGGGEPSSMPTAEAQAFYDSLATGTIGKAYIPASSASTAEIYEFFGFFVCWCCVFLTCFGYYCLRICFCVYVYFWFCVGYL